MLTIVLARPEIPANVGFIARNMACHGLTDLRIVGSPGSALHPDAIRTASGEEAILETAREYPDLDAALADCLYALGFSRRVRDPGQRILDLPEAAGRFGAYAAPEVSSEQSTAPSPGKMAMVFGRESQGLSREETFRCTHLVSIPLPGPMLSLNLSHAVAIALYAFFGGRTAVFGDPTAVFGDRAAIPAVGNPADEVLPLGESEKILSAVITRLLEGGQLKPAKAEAHVDYLRILWQRLQPTRREVEFLAGLLEKLAT